MGPEGVDGVLGLVAGNAQANQHVAGQLQASRQQLADQVLHPGPHQQVGVVAVAGPGIETQVGEALPHAGDDAHRGLGVAHRHHQHPGLVGAGGLEEVDAGGVAEIDLVAVAADEGHLVGVDVEHRVGDLQPLQGTAHDLSEAPEAGEDDLRRFVRQGVEVGTGLPGLEERAHQPGVGQEHHRRGGHRQRHHQHQLVDQGGGQQRRGAGGSEQHEAELAALGEQYAEVEGLAPAGAEGPGRRHHAQGLGQQQGAGEAEDHPGALSQQADLGGHAHGHEEQAQQQAAEGFDVRLDAVAVFRVGQQHTGDEGAQRHGEAGKLHQQGGADHHQQGGAGEYLAAAGAGGEAEQRPQQQPAADDQAGEGADGHQDLLEHRHEPPRQQVLGGQQGDEGQHRDRGQVLEEQQGEGVAAVSALQLVALPQQLQHQRRGAESQAEARHRRDHGRQAERPGAGREQQRGHPDLQAAEAEDRLVHQLEARGLELQADHEQQEDDAHLGELQHGLGIGHQAKGRGADGDPCGEVAQHLAEPEALEDRHDQHRRGEKDQGVEQQVDGQGELLANGGGGPHVTRWVRPRVRRAP